MKRSPVANFSMLVQGFERYSKSDEAFMPKRATAAKNKTYVGINYSFIGVFRAKTKLDGGAKLQKLLKTERRRESASPETLSRYVGQLFYSPSFQKLWYRIPLWSKDDIRALYASEIPESAWSGIEEADPAQEPKIRFRPERPGERLELAVDAFRARK